LIVVESFSRLTQPRLTTKDDMWYKNDHPQRSRKEALVRFYLTIHVRTHVPICSELLLNIKTVKLPSPDFESPAVFWSLLMMVLCFQQLCIILYFPPEASRMCDLLSNSLSSFHLSPKGLHVFLPFPEFIPCIFSLKGCKRSLICRQASSTAPPYMSEDALAAVGEEFGTCVYVCVCVCVCMCV